MRNLLRGRYSTLGSAEGEFEPGSKKRVLKNLFGIKRKREIDFEESKQLEKTYDHSIRIYDEKHQFTSSDICKLHKFWLGDLYSWAGNYRQVNMSKGGFPFAAATQIPRLMVKFEREYLRKFTPCLKSWNLEKIVEAIAIVHAEFILIHPFREGNGRLGRLLSVLMALQADLPPLNYDQVKGKNRIEYFKAVQSGADENYDAMKNVFRKVITRTLNLSD